MSLVNKYAEARIIHRGSKWRVLWNLFNPPGALALSHTNAQNCNRSLYPGDSCKRKRSLAGSSNGEFDEISFRPAAYFFSLPLSLSLSLPCLFNTPLLPFFCPLFFFLFVFLFFYVFPPPPLSLSCSTVSRGDENEFALFGRGR